MRVFKKKTLLGLTLIEEETPGQKGSTSSKDQVLADEIQGSNNVALQNNNKNSTQHLLLDSKGQINCQQSTNYNTNADIDEEAISEVASVLQVMGDMMELTMVLKRNLYLENNRSRFFGRGNSSTQ